LTNRLSIFGHRWVLVSMSLVGLTIIHLSHDLPAHQPSRSTLSLFGLMLFAIVIFKTLKLRTPPEIEQDVEHHRFEIVSLYAVIGTSLLLASHWLRLSSSLHFIANLIAVFAIMLCWTLPRSSWQELPLCGFYVVAIASIHWRNLRVIASIHPAILITIGIISLPLCLWAFRLLDRRATPMESML
jgi:hypothetical protein